MLGQYQETKTLAFTIPPGTAEQLEAGNELITFPSELTLNIGDTLVDEKAATGVGVKFISYKNQSLIADYHVISFREVRDILEGNIDESVKTHA